EDVASTVEDQAASPGGLVAGQAVQQGGLAGAAGAEDAHEGIGPDAEADVPEQGLEPAPQEVGPAPPGIDPAEFAEQTPGVDLPGDGDRQAGGGERHALGHEVEPQAARLDPIGDGRTELHPI